MARRAAVGVRPFGRRRPDNKERSKDATHDVDGVEPAVRGDRETVEPEQAPHYPVIRSVSTNGAEHTATATGELNSTKAACKPKRRVVVTKLNNGKTLGSARSAADGSWSVTYQKSDPTSFTLIVAAATKRKLNKHRSARRASRTASSASGSAASARSAPSS